jgi:hypothetical protein
VCMSIVFYRVLNKSTDIFSLLIFTLIPHAPRLKDSSMLPTHFAPPALMGWGAPPPSWCGHNSFVASARGPGGSGWVQ